MDDTGARLEIVSGKAAGMWLLVESELLLGRQANGAGRLAEDQELSRTHARVALALDGTFTVEDLGSTNGTFVNGSRIQGPRILLVGDTIELGATTAVVRELISPSPDSLPAIPAEGRDATVIESVVEIPPPDETLGATPPLGSSTGVPLILPSESDPSGLALRLTVDFAAREARMSLDEGGDEIHLSHREGAWRLTSPPTD